MDKNKSTHPAPGLDALVNKVREGLPGDVAPGAFGDMKGAILQHDLPLADDHQRRSTALHAFEDVVLERLWEENMGHPGLGPVPEQWSRQRSLSQR